MEKEEKAEFICSAADYRDLSTLCQVRSLRFWADPMWGNHHLSTMYLKKILARTSGTPGKTSLANFYRVEKICSGLIFPDTATPGPLEAKRDGRAYLIIL